MIQEPCSVHDSSTPCLKYTYLSVPRKGVVTIELESMRGSGGELFDQAKYPSLNINGAVLLRFQQVGIYHRNTTYIPALSNSFWSTMYKFTVSN